MNIKVEWSPKAERDMRHIGDRKMQKRIIDAVDLFSESGHGDVRKLRGEVNEFRLRIGDWRVRFTILEHHEQTTMLVLRVRHRGKAYSK